MEIVRVTPDAVPNLTTWLKAHFYDQYPGHSSLNMDKALGSVATVVEQGVALVAVYNGEPAGSIGLLTGDWWWSDDLYVYDKWYVVANDKRGTGAATELLKVAQSYADNLNLQLIISTLFVDDLERKAKFLRRHKFEHVGNVFRYRGAA